MKALLLIIGLALAAGVTNVRAEHDDDAPNYYSDGSLSVSPFVGVNAKKFNPVDGKGDGGFTGLRLEYGVVNTIAVSVEGAAGDTHDRFIDQFGAHFIGYLPFGGSGLAFGGELGWQQFTGNDRRNFLSTGVKIAVRGKRVNAGAGVRWLKNFSTVGFAQYYIEGGLSF